MFNKIKESLKNINYKLFIALLVMGLCPTIYTTLRVFWLGELPSGYSYSIAGQLSWVNLIYEVISEAIILPLFYFMGKVVFDKKELVNRVKTGLIIMLVLYVVISGTVFIFAKELLKLMAVSPEILDMSAGYIRLESIANIFSVLANYVLIVLVTYNKDKYVYLLTGIRLSLSILLDIFLISSLKVSLNLGVNGIAISNIIINVIMFASTLFILKNVGVNIFNKDKLNFTWTKELLKVGGISGVESLVRNLFYMIMISRMVNVVGEQGTYWVANNFIWGWLLLPVIQLGELIKQEISVNKENVRKNSFGYFTITLGIIAFWLITIPYYKPFMTYVLNYSDADKLFKLVMILLASYVLYAIQNVFDSTFYGLGKTNYMLFESIITNIVYYGTCFILYITNVFEPSLIGIAVMFSIGNAFDSVVSGFVYWYMMKKYLKELKTYVKPKRKVTSMSRYNEYIHRYVESEKSNSALMLNASWGSGKSYYIKNELKPFLENEYNIECIIISLYGIKELDEIYRTIYLECKFGSFHDINEDLRKLYISGKAIAKGLIGKYLIDINVDDKDLNDLYKSINLSNKLIIFEDIERSTINKEVILGFINNLVENNNVKVLVVANEKEITKTKNKYLTYKEKTIYDTIYFQSNQYESIESIMLSYENKKFSDLIKINSSNRYDNIIEIMKEVDHYNYRAIIFACNKIIDIFDIIEKIDVQFFDFVFYGVIAYSLRKNKNDVELIWKDEKSGNELGTAKYPLLKYCYEYIEYQYSNANELIKLQKEYIDKINKEEEEIKLNRNIDILNRYYEFTEKEVSHAASEIFICIKNNTITPTLYAKIIGTLISLKHVVKNIDKKMVDQCKKNILRNLRLVDNKEKLFEELKFNSIFEFDNSNYKTEYFAFLDKMMTVLNNTYGLNIDYTIEGFNRLNNNIVYFADKVARMKGFAKYLNISDICKLLKIAPPHEIQIIRRCFLLIYRQIVITKEYISDIPNLELLHKEIKNMIGNKMYFDNISKKQLLWFIENLDEIIKRIKKQAI